MMEHEKAQRFWQDYSATMLGMIGKMLGGESWTVESYIEMAYPDEHKDNRTAKEIVSDILEKVQA